MPMYVALEDFSLAPRAIHPAVAGPFIRAESSRRSTNLEYAMIIAGGGIAGAALGKTIAERGKRVRQRGRDQAIRASVHDA